MNSGEIMVIVIVAIVMVTSIIKAGMQSGASFHYAPGDDDAGKAENQRLRSEVQELKDRIKVLERITVEKENSLANEIESLRDR